MALRQEIYKHTGFCTSMLTTSLKLSCEDYLPFYVWTQPLK
jgi:hypothetical protein